MKILEQEKKNKESLFHIMKKTLNLWYDDLLNVMRWSSNKKHKRVGRRSSFVVKGLDRYEDRLIKKRDGRHE